MTPLTADADFQTRWQGALAKYEPMRVGGKVVSRVA